MSYIFGKIEHPKGFINLYSPHGSQWSSMSMKVARTRIESNEGNVDDTLYTLGLGVGW